MVEREETIAATYASGHVTFAGLDLLVQRGALVPRAETELLASAAIDILKKMALAQPRVIDMCCGAGNLACAIAHYVSHARVWAADLTADCVALTKRNVTHVNPGGRVSVHQGDLFGALTDQSLEGTIDMVVCNPPYISNQRLAGELASLLVHEPSEAFAAGPYGIGIHMRAVREALPFLKPDGFLLMEVGLGQDKQVQMLMERAGEYDHIAVVADPAGHGRVVRGRKRAAAP